MAYACPTCFCLSVSTLNILCASYTTCSSCTARCHLLPPDGIQCRIPGCKFQCYLTCGSCFGNLVQNRAEAEGGALKLVLNAVKGTIRDVQVNVPQEAASTLPYACCRVFNSIRHAVGWQTPVLAGKVYVMCSIEGW
jgi:hypothetical protein